MAIDVKRTYFYAPATRLLFIRIPREDREASDESKVAQLLLSLYGIRDAAMNWTAAYTNFALSMGFEKGKGCLYNFCNKRNIAMTVHGDDFTSTGNTRNLKWLKAHFESKFEITATTLGPELGQ